MADQKITELDANSSPASTDLIATVDDVGGSPVTKKTTIDELDDYLKATTKTLTNKTIDGDDNTLQDIPYSAIKEVAWSEYTPDLTGLTLGNGTLNATYCEVGNLVTVRIYLKFGSTTSITGTVFFSTPVNAIATDSAWTYLPGNCLILDSGTTTFLGVVRLTGAGTVQPAVINTAATYGVVTGFSSSVPMTWAENDFINLCFTYEAA